MTTIILPVSKKFYLAFEEAQGHLEHIDPPFKMVSRDDLEDMRQTYGFDDETHNDNIIDRDLAEQWSKESVDQLNALEAQMQKGHEWMVGGFNPDAEYTEIPARFIASFETEEEAQEHFEYLLFNEALKMAVATTQDTQN